MRITLFVLSLLAFVGGVAFLSAAKSDLNEIEAFMLFVVAATLLAASAVVEAVTSGFKRQERTNELLAKLASEARPAGNVPTATVSAAPASAEPSYVVQTGTDSNGPFPVTKIRELHRRGAIDDDTPVALKGSTEWKKTRDVLRGA